MTLVRYVRVALALLVTSAVAGGQPGATPSTVPSVRWIVTRDAASDLWFHSLAVLRISGPGALPFYDDAYADTIVLAKRRRGGTTLLDRRSVVLRRALLGDRAFELLHFLPFYLTRTQPLELTALLRRVASPTTGGDSPPEVESALRAHFTRESQRRVLVELADAIDDEWRGFYASYAAATSADEARRIRALQARWDEVYAPRLDAWFRALDIPRGVFVVTPALGAEGRIVTLGEAGTVVAVSAWRGSSSPDAPLLAAVRELCFPALQRMTPNAPSARDASISSSRAAVRCGALLLDAFFPAAADEYRSLFVDPEPGETRAALRQRFEARFHVEEATLQHLSTSIARLTASTP